jgi:hypothetical protein
MQGGALPVAVDMAPPPVQIETVPQKPAADCIWADGRWAWAENQWHWIQGGWVRPASVCYYAEPLLVWVPSVDGKGVLFHTPGEWYNRATSAICAPPPVCAVRNRN